MTITKLQVASDVSKDAAWTHVGGSTNYTGLQEPDDTGTYMESDTNTGDSRFSLDNLGPTQNVINSYTSMYRSRRIGVSNSTVRARVTTSGGTSNASTRVMSNASYAEYTDVFATAPGGGAWTLTLVNESDIHYEKTVGGANTETRITTLLVTVDSDIATDAGYYMHLISWLPPLIAAASHALSFRDVAAILSRLKTQPSSREEFCRILDVFRVRPRYSF